MPARRSVRGRGSLVLSPAVLAVLIAGGVFPEVARTSAPTTVHVDCAAPSSGGGTAAAPADTIAAGVGIARGLATRRRVTIAVAPGVCDRESLPIELDFPVWVRGSREPRFDADGLPTREQDGDTLVTWTPPSPVPAAVASLAFFRITSAGVRLSRLSIDGRIPPVVTPPAPPRPAPGGVIADHAGGFLVEQMRIERVGIGVRSTASSGEVRETYTGTLNAGLMASGGEPLAPALFIARNNRIEDYWTGALALAGAGPGGRSLRAILQNNDTSTSYTETGPSNPFALRIGMVFTGTPFLSGSVDADIKGNRVRGTPRHAIIVNAGQSLLRSDGSRYSGSIAMKLADTVTDGAAFTGAPALITFTNSRAVELPCELDSANSRAQCPSLSGNPPQYWDYLQHSRFDLRHSGELDGALIDHPATHPVAGHALGNLLSVNGETVAHQTLVGE